MAETKLKTRSPIIAMEQLTSKFAAAATLASAGFTIPANTGEIIVYPAAACHWLPGTPTATFGHKIAANEPFHIPAAQVGTAKIIGDAGAMTATVAYLRGAGRQDNSYTAQARPN